MNVQQEIWKDIPNYEGSYQASNFGNIRSVDKITTDNRKIKGKIRSLNLNTAGYKFVNLSVNGNKKVWSVHQLIAITFLNHKPSSYNIVVDHINGDKLDNRVENLQLITHRENISKSKKETSSKYTGVCWIKSNKKWRAAIRIDGKVKHIGLFKCELEASNAYQKELRKII